MPKYENEFNIIDYFSELRWLGLTVNQEDETVISGEKGIYYKEDDKNYVYFFSYNPNDRVTNQRYGHLEKVVYDENVDVRDILLLQKNQYKLTYYNQLNNLLNISQGKFKTIEILGKHKGLNFNKTDKTIKLSPAKFLEIREEAVSIYSKTSKHRQSMENYLTNKALAKLGLKIKSSTTYIEKGEFSFVINKLNLRTKKEKKDFLCYLDEKDINDLEILTEKLIKKEVFSDDFLRRLDEYFIKEKLKFIIKLGNDILNLKSDDIKQEKAKNVYQQFSGKPIRQMENVWQVYFEKYLLYLIFSYKKIVPKIRLTGISSKKKYPDFVGVNHYDGIDIIEIKTHLKHALTWDSSHENFAFSGELSKAIIQTMNYIEAIKNENFKENSDLKDLKSNLSNSGSLHDPRGIIIISSKERLAKGCSKFDIKKKKKLDEDFTKLRNSLHNIELITFDEVLGVAESYIENIANEFKV